MIEVISKPLTRCRTTLLRAGSGGAVGDQVPTVRRLFADEPGVLKLSWESSLQKRKQKPHVLLRIPASVVERVHQRWSAGFSLELKPGRRRV